MSNFHLHIPVCLAGAGGMAHGIPSTIKEEEDGDQEDDSGGEKSAQAAEQKSQG